MVRLLIWGAAAGGQPLASQPRRHGPPSFRGVLFLLSFQMALLHAIFVAIAAVAFLYVLRQKDEPLQGRVAEGFADDKGRVNEVCAVVIAPLSRSEVCCQDAFAREFAADEFEPENPELEDVQWMLEFPLEPVFEKVPG